jgi:hypothetical protein
MSSIKTRLAETNRTDIFYYASIGVLSLIVLAAYLFIASKAFFFGDDFLFLNSIIFKFGPFIRLDEIQFFRPVSKELFFLLNYHIFGLEPFGYFVVNIAAHTLSAIGLFFILVKLRLSRKLSALVTFLFFSNVPAFEKITWISNFQHTSYHMFLLLSALLAFLSVETTGKKRILLICFSVISWTLALLSHVASIFFPTILMLLLYVKSEQQDVSTSKKIYSLARTTLAHWIVFFIYVVVIVIPLWKRPDISNPYYFDLSIAVMRDNLVYYFRNSLCTNCNKIAWIAVAFVYAIYFMPRTIKKISLKKSYFLNFLVMAAIFSLLYAPMAFLKYQRYPNYVSLALIPCYIMILYPLFNEFSYRKVSGTGKLVTIVSLIVMTLSFLPSRNSLFFYFKDSPKLQVKSVWEQTHLLLPTIPEGIQKVVFIDSESLPSFYSKYSKEVSIWQTPPFWWHVGHGSMFAIFYRRPDIQFEVAPEKPVTPESNTIYFTVDKGPVSYTLSLLK